MRILRAADYITMPWKNGLGSTTEIAVFPQGATLDDFEWRVSMAQVASDGPFSSFATIDRTLLVLDGHGIDLTVAGFAPVRIDRDVVHSFPGDAPTIATLIDGPIQDLNVMSRRGVVRHHVQRIKLLERHAFKTSTKTLLLVEQGGAEIIVPATATLNTRDAVVVDAGTVMELHAVDADTGLIVAEFR